MTSYVHRPNPDPKKLSALARSPSFSLIDGFSRLKLSAVVAWEDTLSASSVRRARLARDLPLKHRLCMHLELEEKVSNSYNLNSANSETVLLPIFAFEGNVKAQVWERRDFSLPLNFSLD